MRNEETGSKYWARPYLHWGRGRFLLTSCSTAPGVLSIGRRLDGQAGRPLQLPKAQQVEPRWLARQVSESAGGVGGCHFMQ
jgi:hypothetical protein